LRLCAWAVGSCLVSEFLGYLLHRLMHSDSVRFLSRNHMTHHLRLYGPQDDQRPAGAYKDATTNRRAIGNVGAEWLVPGAFLLVLCVFLLHFMRVFWAYRLTFVLCALAWSFLVFSYLHDGMHTRNFWMERNPVFRHWFCSARSHHDIHHRQLNDRGLMDKNFGIGLPFCDWLFGTAMKDLKPLNAAGLQAAFRRYSFVDPRSDEATETTQG